MKRPTDKERMDWLQKNADMINEYRLEWFVLFADCKSTGYGKSLRQAIDAAMKFHAKKQNGGTK